MQSSMVVLYCFLSNMIALDNLPLLFNLVYLYFRFKHQGRDGFVASDSGTAYQKPRFAHETGDALVLISTFCFVILFAVL